MQKKVVTAYHHPSVQQWLCNSQRMQRRGVCGGTAIVSPYLGTQTNAATTLQYT